jgi:hypothetical protein
MIFEEYSSDEEYYDPYDFKKCPYGYYKGCGYCCPRCKSEEREKIYEEYSKQRFYEYIKQNFSELRHETKYNKDEIDLAFEFLKIDKHKFLKLEIHEQIKNIKRQYKRLCLKYHPDKQGSNELFIKLKDCYDLIISGI